MFRSRLALFMMLALLAGAFKSFPDSQGSKQGPTRDGVVSGKVMLDDRPASGGVVVFRSTVGQVVRGKIQPDGSYTAKGVPTGEVKITVALPPLPRQEPNDKGAAKHQADGAAQQKALARLKVSELIDKLQEESDQGVGFHATAWTSGFMAVDQEPQFGGGIIGSRKPVTSPVMRELVRRGVDALPGLLEHLSDKRMTKVRIGTKFIISMWHSDEYSPRQRDPQKQPRGVNSGKESAEGFFDRLRVGDLCYVAIGQIVNRNLSAIRYQPSSCLVINSPVQTPALAAAVRKDWAGLTADQHRRSLSEDASTGNSRALLRLWFYYPDRGEPSALKVLARPLVKRPGRLWDFIDDRLMKEENPSRWEPLIDGFRREEGQAAADLIPSYLAMNSWRERTPEQKETSRRALAILARVYPQYDRYSPPFINATTVEDLEKLISGIAPLRSPKVDRAVAEAFRLALRTDPFNYSERIRLDDLALACLPRLVGKGYDGLFKPYLAGRIKFIEATPASSAERYRLDSLREWDERLKAAPPQ
jgi:hypothetical protein